MGILVGLAVLAAIILAAYVITHHKAPATPSGADLAQTLAGAASDSWEAIKRDLPTIVSAELAQARADLAAMSERAQKAEADLAAAQQAHQEQLASVAQRVAAAVTDAGLPAQ